MKRTQNMKTLCLIRKKTQVGTACNVSCRRETEPPDELDTQPGWLGEEPARDVTFRNETNEFG